MRCLTYNIHGWRTTDGRPNVPLVGERLASADADVIALNEVFHPAPLADGGSALEWLADRLGMVYAFAACGLSTFPGSSAVCGYGNALLSRAPPRSVRSGLFSPIARKEQRGFLEGCLDLGSGQTLTALVTHLDHTDEEARLAQLEDLLACVVRRGRGPDLILGDFNCVHPGEYEGRPEALAALGSHPVAGHLANHPDGPRVAGRLEQAGYVDALLHLGVRGRGTFLPAEEPVRLDYVWVAPPFARRLTGAAVLEVNPVAGAGDPGTREPSDHRPVLVEWSPG